MWATPGREQRRERRERANGETGQKFGSRANCVSGKSWRGTPALLTWRSGTEFSCRRARELLFQPPHLLDPTSVYPAFASFPLGIDFFRSVYRGVRGGTSPMMIGRWLLEVQAMPRRPTHKNVKEIFEEVQVGYHSVPFPHRLGEDTLALLSCQATINMENTRTDRW